MSDVDVQPGVHPRSAGPQSRRTPRTRAGLTLVTTLVVGWRLAAFYFPSEIVVVENELRLPLLLMGLMFLACGVAVCLTRRDRIATVFFVCTAGGAVHWGGSIGGPPGLEMALFFLYLAASVAGEAALLEVALRFPGVSEPNRRWEWLYAPAVLGVAMAPVARWLPGNVLMTVAGLILLVASALGVIAALVFLARLVRGRLEPRSRRQHLLVLVAMSVSFVVATLGSAATLPHPEGISAEIYNLFLVAIPVTLAAILIADRPRDRAQSGVSARA